MNLQLRNVFIFFLIISASDPLDKNRKLTNQIEAKGWKIFNFKNCGLGLISFGFLSVLSYTVYSRINSTKNREVENEKSTNKAVEVELLNLTDSLKDLNNELADGMAACDAIQDETLRRTSVNSLLDLTIKIEIDKTKLAGLLLKFETSNYHFHLAQNFISYSNNMLSAYNSTVERLNQVEERIKNSSNTKEKNINVPIEDNLTNNSFISNDNVIRRLENNKIVFPNIKSENIEKEEIDKKNKFRKKTRVTSFNINQLTRIRKVLSFIKK